MAADSTSRFSNRVEDYVKYRPHYPDAVLHYLQEQYHLAHDAQIADIGAGTGISAEPFLKAGYAVTGIEPNREMREKSIELLQEYARFRALDSTAEHTGLDGGSMDMIIAGQAFHWFDAAGAKAEFRRIGKPGCITAIIWNERLTASPFEQDYDELIRRHARDYVEVDHRNIGPEDMARFFAPAPVALQTFPNHQTFDLQGLAGRLASSSYMPPCGEAGYGGMMQDLQRLFEQYQQGGTIRINYQTLVYSGRLG